VQNLGLLRWLCAIVLAALALWLSLLNWITLVRQLRSTSSSSWIPLFGGLLGLGALLVAPHPIAGRFWWVPFLVDGGSLPGLATTLVWHLVRRGRHVGRR
jgi:hypothetical protein